MSNRAARRKSQDSPWENERKSATFERRRVAYSQTRAKRTRARLFHSADSQRRYGTVVPPRGNPGWTKRSLYPRIPGVFNAYSRRLTQPRKFVKACSALLLWRKWLLRGFRAQNLHNVDEVTPAPPLPFTYNFADIDRLPKTTHTF